MRTIIIGAPKTGKTTLATNAAKVGLMVPVYHTDSLIPGRSWADQGDAAFELLSRANREDPEGFVYEGVLAVRALSRWIKTQPGKPCDEILVLTVPRVQQTQAQITLGKGILTTFATLVSELRRRGVHIEWDRD